MFPPPDVCVFAEIPVTPPVVPLVVDPRINSFVALLFPFRALVFCPCIGDLTSEITDPSHNCQPDGNAGTPTSDPSHGMIAPTGVLVPVGLLIIVTGI